MQEPARPVPSSPHAGILALQRAAGNRAVSQLAQPNKGSAPLAGAVLQRKCASCAASGGECIHRKDEEQTLQRNAEGAATPTAVNGVPPIVHSVLNSGSGQPLDLTTRTFMESRFGEDFSQVRVHTDSKAARSARAVDALAYTVGRDLVFGNGQYAPHSSKGRRLLAHELAHVVQQRRAEHTLQPRAIGSPDTGLEREADASAQRVAGGQPATVVQTARKTILQRFMTKEPAGGCGICYDVAFPGKGPPNAGRVAHTVIQTAFERRYFLGVREFPFCSPTDENGRLDLAIETLTGFMIGEIKPATPAGLEEGLKDLSYYRWAFQTNYPNVNIELLTVRVPVGTGLVMPDPLARAAGCPEQMIAVLSMAPGLYGYFCEPPYSQVRRTCPCRRPRQKQEKVKEKMKEKVAGQRLPGEGDKLPIPPPNVPVPPAPKAKVTPQATAGAPAPAPSKVAAPSQVSAPASAPSKIPTAPPVSKIPILSAAVEPASAPKAEITPQVAKAARPPSKVAALVQTVGGAGLKIGVSVGAPVLAGMLESYLKFELDRKEINKDVQAKRPDIEQKISALAPQVTALRSKSPEATVYANTTLKIMRARYVSPSGGGFHESVAQLYDVSVAVSGHDIQTGESDSLTSDAWYIKLFTHTTQMTISVPILAAEE